MLFASVAAGALLAPLPSAAQQSGTEDSQTFDIAAQPLAEALTDFGRQSGRQVSVDAEIVRGRATPGVRGRMSAAQAISRLLAGTGLTYRVSGRTITIARAPEAVQGAIELDPLRVEGQGGRAGSGGASRRDSGVAGGSDRIFVTPRAVSEITREEMDRTPARHAADMLVATPGVSSAVNRLDPGLSVNIRGMQDFGRVNMMIDGMRQNFVRNGHQQRNGQMYLDPELISAVTVERGPRTDVHGAGAIGGSVNFRTLDFADLIEEGEEVGLRLRGATGLGAEGNGVEFIGSGAFAARAGALELMGAYSRRQIGDYDPGERGGGTNTALEYLTENGFEGVSTIRYASQRQDSALGKARLTIADDHWLQFTYAGTWVDYSNLTEMIDVTGLDPNGSPWRNLGPSQISSDNFALDYRFKPDNDWLDLRLKLYTVRTRNWNYTNAREPTDANTATLVESAWRLGFCERDPIPTAWQTPCTYGYGTDQRIQTQTHGVQFDNTARFDLGGDHKLSVNFGGEYYRDKASSDIAIDRLGRVLEGYNQYGQGDLLNPEGRRSMASGFANLTLESERYTLSAGLRYDHFWLNGQTQVPGVVSTYQTRFDRFMANTCGRTTALAIRQCEGGRTGGEAWVIANVRNYQTNATWAPTWLDAKSLYDFEVDRSEGRFLPSISLAVRPTDWLEFYGSWAKSWRPPAINETLMTGGHPGDPLSSMYANPFADPEKTTSWEIGANLTFDGLIRKDDALLVKVGYFDTRAKDYLYTSLNSNLPGDNLNILLGFGRVLFVNNRTTTRFRGIEFEGRYDAGPAYASVAGTFYLGRRNNFCQDLYPVGAGTSKYDQPNEDGSITPERQQALDAGFPSWQAWAEGQVVCNMSPVMNSVAGERVDRVSLTLGIRPFGDRLDTGLRLITTGSGDVITFEDQRFYFWDGYTTLDWYGSFTLNKHVTAFASAQNLTDRRYIDANGDIMARVLAPGRTVQAGLQVKF